MQSIFTQFLFLPRILNYTYVHSILNVKNIKIKRFYWKKMYHFFISNIIITYMFF